MKTETVPLREFRDYAAGREGTFDFFDLDECALAQFARHRHPEAQLVTGGVTQYHTYSDAGDSAEGEYTFDPPLPFYVLRVSHHCSWSELAARLDAVLGGDHRYEYGWDSPEEVRA